MNVDVHTNFDSAPEMELFLFIGQDPFKIIISIFG
jgi:hypothetical protein